MRSVIVVAFFIVSCNLIAQNKELDTTYLYLPYKISYDIDDVEINNEEKVNLDYIFEKIKIGGYDKKNYFTLSINHCPEELEKDEFISFKRLKKVFDYLVYDRNISRENIRFEYGDVAPTPSCKRMGLLINTYIKE